MNGWQSGGVRKGMRVKSVLLARNFTLNFDADPNFKICF